MANLEVNIRPLSLELAQQARDELNEDPKKIASDIQHIKDWLSKQQHLTSCTDNQWLITFLRGCKYSLERTKEKLDVYYSLRSIAPELFNIRHDTPLFEEILKIGAYVLLPETEATKVSSRTLILRPGQIDTEKNNIDQFFAVSLIFQKILFMDDDVTVISGLQTIVDLENVKIGHMLQMTPSIMKKMIVYAQDASPLRMKGFHFVNVQPIFEKILSTVKSLLNEKNRNRVYVYKNYEELHNKLPKSILPKEFGGDSASLKEISDSWIAKREQYSAWLEQDQKNGSDESKRQGQPKTADSLFGIDGSFRQIDFD